MSSTQHDRLLAKWESVVHSSNVKSIHEAVALVLHLYMLEQNCALTSITDANLGSSTIQQLPQEWNASNDVICFVYKRIDSSFVILKFLILGRSLHINALLHHSSELHSAPISVDDYAQQNESDSTFEITDISSLVNIFEEKILSHVLPQSLRQDPLRIRSEIPFPGYDIPVGLQPAFGSRPGDFDGDLMPFPRGLGPPVLDPRGGGNLMGPDNPIFDGRTGIGRGRGRGRGRGGPRFDPFGPGNINGDPDYDHLPPPGGAFNGFI